MVKVKIRPRFSSKRNLNLMSRNSKSANDKKQLNMGKSKHVEEKLDLPSRCATAAILMETPTKSANDCKDYRVVKLKNGLTALLISDPTPVVESEDETDDEDEDESESDESDLSSDSDGEEDGKDSLIGQGNKLAAAGLCIGVGSFSDPPDIPGLAHFLEHMVFMGSEKYPAENSFDAYIKRRGGDSNAYTDCERTNFYFEIHKKHLHEALDRFAQFFISPLLNKSSVDREIEAVDNEFQSCLQSDNERMDQLLGSFSINGHPMGKFMWGNVNTLKNNPAKNNINVYSRLAEFRKRFYLASLMTLSIQSQESLDTLEKWVQEIFSDVPTNESKVQLVPQFDRPFNTPEFRRIYRVVSVGSSNLLILNWSFPRIENYREKPLEYILFLIGHEGKGSLLSYLKQQVWALNLWTENSSYGFTKNSTNTFFSFTVELTDSGMAHLFEVLTAIFSYISMLKSVGPQERIYEEIQLANNNSFRWQEEIQAIDYVEQLAENMQLYPSIDYITGEELYFRFDGELINQCLQRLVPEDLNIIVLSKAFENENICDKKEPWFETLYNASDINPDWLEHWKNVEHNSAFFIPTPNTFLATDFSLKLDDVDQFDVPVKILDCSKGRLWYKKDLKFKAPKAIIGFHLTSPIVDISPLNGVLADLFISALDQNLREDVYPAQVAMLEYSIEFILKGMLISVQGFNHKIKDLLETIIDHIANFDVTDSLFEAVKTNTGKQYYNTFIKPNKLARDIHRSIVHHTYWSPLEKRLALAAVNKEMLLAFVKDFKKRLYIESLCQGNLTSQEALHVYTLVQTKLHCGEVPSQEILKSLAMKIPQGNSYCRVEGLNSEDGKSVITNYYQLGPGNIYSTCLIELLINIMEEPCFDYLRTREQLGYHVYCVPFLTFGIVGFGVTVQTSVDKFSCSVVDAKIEEFLSYFRKYLSELAEEDFQIQVNSLIKAKQQPDLHLKEEVSRNSSEILSGCYVFDRLEKEVQCLQNITLNELRERFTDNSTNVPNFNKLSIQVQGRVKSNASKDDQNNPADSNPKLNYLELNDDVQCESNVIMDLKTYKDNLEVFPLTRITR